MSGNTNWIYNNYEFENRVNNLAWTVCGMYEEDIDSSEKDYSSKDVSLYFGIIAGARRKYLDWDIIKKYIISRIKKSYDKDILYTLIELVLNSVVEDKVINERPGVEEIRSKAYKDILVNYSKINKEDILQTLRYTFILQAMNRHPAVDGLTRRIMKDIKSIDCNDDLMNILKRLDEIYLTYFEFIINSQREISQGNEQDIKNVNVDFDTFSDFMYEELYMDEEIETIESEINNISNTMLVENLGEMGSGDLGKSSNRVIYVDEVMAQKIYDKVEYYYGKAFLSESEIRKIETKHCRDVHEGCRVHFTDGVLRSECNNVFQLKYVTRQKENNLYKYRNNIKLHKRSINKLKESISRILIEESAIDRIYSDGGTICANRAWRIGRSNNSKVFYKDIRNEKGKYVIDILLDASGSQSRNQFNVAIQAYIIATALTSVGIPNRVMGYLSFLDYTILKRYRDYNDNINSCENIFEYFAAGNNRDGLAIKAASDSLLEREEENKILIILSDGKPNDVKIGKDRSRSLRGEASYKGMIAVKDTALEVRKARKQGILVLGVFTGKEKDLEAEKIIYGQDFIYTKDIERFSDIVAMYLKKIIKN
ncbi:MAG TPA: nitric oxide reductase activation-like protein [Terrisporobacter glycolicus]|uniref:VWA domain-containing protein n=1 Tax=Terrisporobacter hibernicus TaxID=2813371 RepID=A0AAX2ZJ62_9FIRM|nr:MULTISPECIES: VWA domain-containing protein [Terrisporobacter]MBN9647861.1 VWA domain-containing protein [Terrisporobacter glycolicus]UEL49379.1 VWA domain-containing protein [Terrisporobacter hibernicus]HBI92799.1 nitric oxide reductase activation-like protein [Terrisporobacter hibernicus]